MPPTYTPLRYPGGKAKLGPYLAEVVRHNRLIDGTYAEPYAGGAGAGLYLLFRGYTTRLFLNDIDRGVAAFWRAILDSPERFARSIETVPLSVEQWDEQRAILASAASGFELGFAFFFVNRTSRSGIMNAGVIGGRDQRGEWTIDARFTRANLADRVRAIGRMRKVISISRLDAVEFVESMVADRDKRRLLYLDPPYYAKGQHLYPNFYTADDHRFIARKLRRCSRPWLLTYDDCPDVRSLYNGLPILESELSYSARAARRGREVVVFGGGLDPLPLSNCTTAANRRGFQLM